MEKKHYTMRLWDMHTMIYCSLFIFILGGLATISYYGNNNQEVARSNPMDTPTTTITNESTNTYATRVFDRQSKLKIAPPSSTCDLFSGRWVHDNKNRYPLYKENECPYLDDNFACQTYGRNETKYLQWRWQPHSCRFPTFNGKAIAERLKGKRLLFVGDSLIRNQWNSMICMLHSSIPGVKKTGGSLNGLLHTFRAIDYNISIDFYWAPMLVESNGDSPTDHHRDDRIFRLNTIEKHAKHWIDADILVFNSYHWWRSPLLKLVQNVGSLLEDPNQVFEEVDYLRAYEMGLKTWSKWAGTHIDPSKTKLFFMSATATHSRAKEWRGKNGASCYGETEPVMDDEFWERASTDPEMLSILDSTLIKMKANGVNVQLINITQLTQCRKDAHTTIYRKQWRPLTELQKKFPERAADCSHWCLPGVPDVWNELLLAYI